MRKISKPNRKDSRSPAITLSLSPPEAEMLQEIATKTYQTKQALLRRLIYEEYARLGEAGRR